jgi:hypothetical protein
MTTTTDMGDRTQQPVEKHLYCGDEVFLNGLLGERM